jgi:hypothetical protein
MIFGAIVMAGLAVWWIVLRIHKVEITPGDGTDRSGDIGGGDGGD